MSDSTAESAANTSTGISVPEPKEDEPKEVDSVKLDIGASASAADSGEARPFSAEPMKPKIGDSRPAPADPPPAPKVANNSKPRSPQPGSRRSNKSGANLESVAAAGTAASAIVGDGTAVTNQAPKAPPTPR